MVKEPLDSAIWRMTFVIFVIVQLVALGVFFVCLLTPDWRSSEPVWVLVVAYIGFLVFSYLVFVFLKFVRRAVANRS